MQRLQNWHLYSVPYRRNCNRLGFDVHRLEVWLRLANDVLISIYMDINHAWDDRRKNNATTRQPDVTAYVAGVNRQLQQPIH